MAKRLGSGRELLIMRHAKSSWDATVRSDFERPLNARGKRSAPRMGTWLLEQELLPDLLLVSTARRAQETAELLLDAWGEEAPELLHQDRLYGASPQTILGLLAELPASVRRPMVVGHNPGLEYLVVHLVGGYGQLSVDDKVFPTAALAHLGMPEAWEELSAGCGELLQLKRVRELGD